MKANMGGVNSITVDVVCLKEEFGTDVADKVIEHDEEAFRVSFRFTIGDAIDMAILCGGPFEIELSVDRSNEGVGVVKSDLVGWDTVDYAED